MKIFIFIFHKSVFFPLKWMKEKCTFFHFAFSPLNRNLLRPQDGSDSGGGIQAGTSCTWAPWMGQLVLRDVVRGWLSPWAEEMPTEERAGVTQGERGWSSLGPGTVAPPASPVACCPLQHPVLWGRGPSSPMIWNLGPQLLPLAWDPRAGPALGAVS